MVRSDSYNTQRYDEAEIHAIKSLDGFSRVGSEDDVKDGIAQVRGSPSVHACERYII